MSDRLFPIDDIPEIPLLREPRRSRGEHDARFRNDYPPSWHRCPECKGKGEFVLDGGGRDQLVSAHKCSWCRGMGSLKARVRLEAGHRCERCKHPYIPKGDAEMLGVEPSWRGDGWSACDDECLHTTPVRFTPVGFPPPDDALVEAQWRILTVHHLDGDKANCAWWNLCALCQRCHLEVQAKVVMERIYPHEHTSWFKPHAAAYYAKVYLGQDLTREDTLARLDELLALELVTPA